MVIRKRIQLQIHMGMILILIVTFWTLPVHAVSVTKQPVTEINVSLGNSAGELMFFPAQLEFAAGQRYKLLLDNPSGDKHYFTSKDFADASWTQKVEAGKVEVKGAIHEVELKPGTYELHCSVPGHAEAVMTGQIVVANQ